MSAELKVTRSTRDLDDGVIEMMAACRYDPWKWAEVAWDWGHGELKGVDGPREWQDDIFDEISSRLANPATRYQPIQIAVSSGHGIGKSAGIGMLLNWAMSCWSDAMCVVTANTATQMATKTVPEVSKWFRRSITGHMFDVQAQSITARDKAHVKNWRTDFVPWSVHNTEAFAGLHNKDRIIVVIYDEASGIDDKVWEVTEGALTDENTVIIWIVFGNPTQPTGRFRECFRRLKHRWYTKQVDSRTVPGTNKEQIARWAEDYGEDSDWFKVRVRGMFPATSAKQFISTTDVDAAFGRNLRKEQYSFAPVILGVDPAWTGADDFVIVKRQGLYSEILRVIPYNDNDVQMASLIANLEDEHKADAVFVDMGYGTGIVSAGKVMGRDWRLVSFSEKPIDKGMLNKRVEMWRGMRDWLKEGGSIPPDQMIYDDLVGPETLPRLDGKMALESKEDMKERGLVSPNRGDALALTFAYPVVHKVRQPLSGESRRGGVMQDNLNRNPYDGG